MHGHAKVDVHVLTTWHSTALLQYKGSDHYRVCVCSVGGFLAAGGSTRRPAAFPSLALAGEQLPARSFRGAPEVSHAAGDHPLHRNQSLPGSAENDEEDAGKQAFRDLAVVKQSHSVHCIQPTWASYRYCSSCWHVMLPKPCLQLGSTWNRSVPDALADLHASSDRQEVLHHGLVHLLAAHYTS